jgi:hypothetical protein
MFSEGAFLQTRAVDHFRHDPAERSVPEHWEKICVTVVSRMKDNELFTSGFPAPFFEAAWGGLFPACSGHARELPWLPWTAG